MLPVLICQFYPAEGPGFFAQFLDEQCIPWHLLRLDQNQTLPENLEPYAALVMMGGPMSANDDLPWIPPLLNLIRQAHTQNLPILGHCLGGQLIAKALGASVSSNPVKEIGWGSVTPSQNKIAKTLFGESSFNVFHWHGETFNLPDGATHLLSSAYCHNQAFALGNTLALQCHIEMTSDMVHEWCIEDADYHKQGLMSSPAVQTLSDMHHELESNIKQLQQKARTIYQHWLKQGKNTID